MAYSRNPTWKDYPDTSTPIVASKLENIENGLVNAATTADSAASQASQAETDAQSAITKANNAQSTANSAQSAATSATSTANDAKSTALSAQNAAQSAQAAAQNSATSAQNSANLVGAPADSAIATAAQASNTQTRAALDAAYARLADSAGPLLPSRVTQNLYARTQPTPDGGVSTIRPLIGAGGDPAATSRVWAIGSRFGQIGYTDDHGGTFVAKTTAGSQPVQGALIANGYMWVVTSNGAHTGQLYRSPAPAADGSGLSFTLMFDIAAPPSGITTGDNASFRNSCVAVSGANVYLIEYSTATITGGPSCYYSADSGATWTKVKTWANAKHCHAVKVIGGVPWVAIGDGGTSFTDIGLWNATSAAATVWNQRSLYGEAVGGNTFYPINFFPLNIGGQPMIVGEYDGNRNYGPLVFGSQSTTVTKALLPTFQMPAAYLGTMRQLTLTPEGNLMWVHTGEGGAVGPQDSIVISKGPHFTQPVVLESFSSTGSTLGTLGDPIVDGAYVWFGTYRIAREKFIGQ